MFPLFKFTLNNSVKGGLEIDDPDGWDEIELILERDQEFHSIVEGVEVPLIFYGPAREYILDVLFNQGADSVVNITIELSTNEGTSYTTIFQGVLSLESAEELYEGTKSKSIQVPIMQNEFWQKFKNRYDTPVQIGGTTDLDGDTRETISSYVLNLPCQIIDKSIDFNYNASRNEVYPPGGPPYDVSLTEVYHLVGWTIEVNELNAYSYPSQLTDISPINDKKFVFTAVERGDLDITGDVDILYDIDEQIGAVGNYSVEWVVVVNGVETSLGLSSGNTASSSVNVGFVKTFNQTVSVSEGDEVYIFGRITADNFRVMEYYIGSPVAGINRALPLTLNLVYHSEVDDSTTEAWKIHETFHSACNLITGQNGSFYSEFLGNTSTSIVSYLADGDGSYNALTGGINIRGKTLTEKPVFTSVKTLWDGANPIYNLGLGYEQDGSSNDIIRVEVKEHFYQSNPHTTLSNINKLVRRIDDSRFIKSIQTGYKVWKSEQIGGLDDPQTKHDYATRFKTFGDEIKLLSDYYTASLGIESTRRKSLQETEDWKLDDELMMIATNRNVANMDTPELSEDFATTGLLNEATRYNVRLSPARMLLRWGNVLSAGLTKYLGSLFRFVGGEGNYDMRSQALTADRGDYDGGLILIEDADIEWDYGLPPLKPEQRPIFIPVVYEFDYPITFDEYESFKNNRKRSFYISESDTNHKEVFLLRLEYQPSRGSAKFECLKAYDPPETPSNVIATLNTSTERYTVSWTDNSGNETGFIVEVNHNSLGFEEIGTVDADVTSLLDSTHYTEGDTIQYRVRGYNEDGYGYGATSGIYTVAYAPDQPSSVNATLNSDTGQYTVTWIDESNDEDGFTIERNVDGGGWVSVGTTLQDDDDIIDPRVFSIGESVIYRVKATNAVGGSAWRESAEHIVPPINVPSDVVASYSNSTWKYTVTWTDNSTNETGFQVFRSVNFGPFTQIATTPLTSWIDDAYHSIGDSLRYQVRAYNGTGNSATVPAMEQTVPGIGAPTGIGAIYEDTEPLNYTVSWTDNSNNEQYFELQVNVDGNGYSTLASNITLSSYTDQTEYNVGQTVQYRVRATNPNGESAWDTEASAHTVPVSASPAPPSDVVVSWNSFFEDADVSWEDNANNEDAYQVQRSVNAGPWEYLAGSGALPADTTFFRDDNGGQPFTPGDTLEYRVRCYNSEGTSNWVQGNSINVP